ncbi:hypothetical protein WN55_08221 [Dufourea novaeangliae]|uniref:Uncharacterized protein n=1 Tax=Dufourea novaeangliae TaxID=178035 RepID=A0A154PSQ3_DUFNO|nr:hypothetical protein WN55_08221 [Dufourea novaeangliae]
MTEADVHSFRENCLRFHVTVSNEIRKRLPHDHQFLKQLSVLKASNVFGTINRKSACQDLVAVAQRLGNFDTTELQKEWNLLYVKTSKLVRDNWAKLAFDDMWVNICELENPQKSLLFPTLRSLLNTVRCLPAFECRGRKSLFYPPRRKIEKTQ